MAMTFSSVGLTAEDSKALTYTKPSGNYGFIPQPTIDAPVPFSITDNGDGTGTVKFAGPVTGTFGLWTIDRP